MGYNVIGLYRWIFPKRWMSGVTNLDRISNRRIGGTTKVGEILKKAQERRLVEVVWACIEKRSIIYGQTSDGDGGAA